MHLIYLKDLYYLNSDIIVFLRKPLTISICTWMISFYTYPLLWSTFNALHRFYLNSDLILFLQSLTNVSLDTIRVLRIHHL